MAKFTVDTHLFRELGELLVGRDSTALIELIKNAYDADATEVTAYGERLDSPNEGRILVRDNGVGMNAADFENGFLRVASRLKEQGERRSTLFQRRYTGAKGIGRLAAHKLARKLEVDSVPRASESEGLQEMLSAAIDWDEIERYETLDELGSIDAIRLETKAVHENAHPVRRSFSRGCGEPGLRLSVRGFSQRFNRSILRRFYAIHSRDQSSKSRCCSTHQ